jgi:hypothetical protein
MAQYVIIFLLPARKMHEKSSDRGIGYKVFKDRHPSVASGNILTVSVPRITTSYCRVVVFNISTSPGEGGLGVLYRR